MKPRRTSAAMLALVAVMTNTALLAEPFEIQQAQAIALDIFDNEAAEMAEGVQIVNGKIVLTGTAEKKAEKAEKGAQVDPAGEQVLELTDGSQLHGELTNLGKSELVWKRGDTTEPLIFSPQDVQRISIARTGDAAKQKSNATLKLHGGDWLTGDLLAFEKGSFRLAIDGAGTLEIERGKVEWLYLSKANPPDTYEGPMGPMGLAGWDGGSVAWDYADGALVARAAMAITRRFNFLPEKMDLEFSASDGGNAIRGLTLWLQPSGAQGGYSKGSVYLRFQGNNISVNSYDGNNMKNFSANVPDNKKPPKETRYRLLQDKRRGKLIVFVNGAKVADWDLQPLKDPSEGGSLSWQPTYWSSNMAWTLSKVRMRPWDGSVDPDPKAEEAGKDLLSIANAGNPASRAGSPLVNDVRVEPKPAPAPPMRAGTLEAITATAVRFSGKDVSRNEPVFIRLAANQAADPAPGAVARVWLKQRGEFDVTALGVRDGQFKVRTSFAGDISLPLTAIRAIEFPHRLAGADKLLAETGDTLIFRNSDELRGTLISAKDHQAVKWKPVKGERTVDFSVDRLAGVLLAKKAKPATANNTAAVRFRNGDWLPGEMLLLDKSQLHFKSPVADSLQLPRAGIQAIYFSQGGEIPVWDGANERQLWMKGFADGRYGSSRTQRKDDTDKRLPWRYLDGSFTLPKSAGRGNGSSGPSLGRVFDSMPDKVEVSFDLSTPSGAGGYAIQLFSEENRSGLMIQGGWDSAYIYDMSPQKRGGVFMNQPQQIEFGEQVGSEGNRRRFRFLADRRTGRLVMIVNGIPVGQFGNRPGKESAKPGRGIAIVPQQFNSSITISNLWIGPWSGDPPSVPKSAAKTDRQGGRQNNAVEAKVVAEKPAEKEAKPKPSAPPPLANDLITLVNGDESNGELENATASEISLKCDVGTIGIPLSRTLMVEFAGAAQPPAAGIRLHLAGKGTLTVDSLHFEDGKVICHSATAGDLTFAADAVSEIVFQPRNLPPPEKTADNEAQDNRGRNMNGNVIFGGGLQIRGNVIINGGAVIVR